MNHNITSFTANTMSVNKNNVIPISTNFFNIFNFKYLVLEEFKQKEYKRNKIYSNYPIEYSNLGVFYTFSNTQLKNKSNSLNNFLLEEIEE